MCRKTLTRTINVVLCLFVLFCFVLFSVNLEFLLPGAACPLCTRLGLQEDINETKEVMKKATEDAGIVSNLKELWEPLEKLEKRVDETEVDILHSFVSLYPLNFQAKLKDVTNQMKAGGQSTFYTCYDKDIVVVSF